jgi:hypothetical protein
MAYVLNIRMATYLLLLAARLVTMTRRILAFSGGMTGLETVMRAAFEFLSAYLSATNIWKPTLLILKSLLTAHAPLLHKKRAFGASFVVLMAVMGDDLMSTYFWSRAWISARRCFGAARQGWL